VAALVGAGETLAGNAGPALERERLAALRAEAAHADIGIAE